MSGVKIANENTTNGVSGEPMGGMSGSYSNLALFPSTTNYIFAWQSRGAFDLTLNAWMGTPYTQCSPRWLNHNVAIATMSKKDTLTGAQASSVVGAAEGDDQVNWITYSSTEDHQNVHVATINSNLSIVTWETLTNPDCQPVPLGCTGTYAGTSFQFIDSAGAKIGNVANSTDVFVSGDIANVGTDKVCWPYVEMTWDLSAPLASGTPVTKMSFACASTGGESTVASSSSSVVASSTAVPVSSSSSSSSSAAAVVSSSVSGAGVGTSSSVETTASALSSKVAVISTTAAQASSLMGSTSSAGTLLSVPTSSISASPVSASSSLISNTSTSISSRPSTSAVISTSSIALSAVSPTTALAHHVHTSKHAKHLHTTFSTKVKPSSTAVPELEDDSCDSE
jgi:hypothetical protein